MPYTLGQASKATGISKPTLSRAIKSGKLSGQKKPDGSFLIDPAELHRVYPLVVATSNDNGNVEHSETPSNPKVLQAQLEALREERERERRQLQATIDDLRGRLDEETAERRQSAGEIRRLTLLLTDQRPPAPPRAELEPAPPLVRPFFWFTLAAIALGAVWYYAWPWWGNRQ